MGAVNSCCIPRTESSMKNYTSTPKEKGHRRNLSATFNLSVIENTNIVSNLVNVNTANEEELMTLPGVNRVIAKSIVDYRNHIGGFRKVEDLALTPGVGAMKLAMIRMEVYVDSPNIDENEEAKQSLLSYEDRDLEFASAICINSANIFSLLRVKGIGMHIAKSIVAYRDKHGRFTRVDELLKVKGIGVENFETMRPFLTVEDKQKSFAKTDDIKNGNYVNGAMGHSTSEKNELDKACVVRSQSLENLLKVLGPLARVPVRPKVDNVILEYKHRQVFRLASWDLDHFSQEKAINPGVKDVVCMIVLENGFGIVAVQGLVGKDALNEICRELNSPTLPNVRKWTGRRGQWSCVISEAANETDKDKLYHGLLYDKSQSIEIIHSSLVKCNSADENTNKPFFVKLKINQEVNLLIVSFHIKTTDEDFKGVNRIHEVMAAARQELKGDENIIFMGDLHQTTHGKKALDDLRKEGFVECISSEIYDNINKCNAPGAKCCSNIWISRGALDIFTGVSGVIIDGLSSTWIPNGWSWGNVVSHECPVYAQLYCSKT